RPVGLDAALLHRGVEAGRGLFVGGGTADERDERVVAVGALHAVDVGLGDAFGEGVGCARHQVVEVARAGHRGDEQLFFGREVPHDQAVGDAGALGDLPDGRAGVAAFGERAAGGLEDGGL